MDILRSYVTPHLLRHLPPSPPTLFFLPSSKSYPSNALFPSSSSLSSLHPLFHQRNKATLIQQQCTRIASSFRVGTSATVVSEQEAEESEEKPADSRTRLIAQNIPWTCTVEEIKILFERHGTVIDVELSMYDNIRNRGLAFITMASEEEALSALSSLNSYDMNGRVIKVGYARSLKKKPDQETAAPTTTFNVFVGNLAWRVRSRDLKELFGNAGKLISAEVIFQSNPRRSAGYGFVSYATEEEAKAAIATHNDKRLMGRKVRLILGKPQADKSEGQSSDDMLPFEVSRESNPSGEILFETDDSLDLA